MKVINYKTFTWIVMALSGITFIEPAPTDLGIIVLLIYGIVLGRLKYIKKMYPVFIILYLFLVANIISFFKVDSISSSARFFTITLYLMISVIFYVGFVGAYKEEGIRILFSGYTFAATLSALFGLLVYFSVIPGSEAFLKANRICGLFKDPNVFGPFMIPISLYALSNIENNPKKSKWIIVFILTSLAVLLSYSRAAWGCYAVALTCYFGLRFIKRPNFKILFKVFLFLMFIGASLYFIASVPQVHDMLTQRFAFQDYDIQRFAKQGQAFSIIKNHPFGIGPGQTALELNYATHNGYLRVWLENGFFGLIIFLVFLFCSLFRSIKKAFETKSSIYYIAAASIIALMINSVVIDTIHWRHLWFIMAVPWFNYALRIEKE